jgi:hypothetical protein
MTSLDDIRASILHHRDQALRELERSQRTVDCMVAELEAHDRAVAAMGSGAAKPARAPRRDIGALVREALTDQPQTLAQIAEKVGVPPSRALPALEKIAGARTSAGFWQNP